MNHPEFDIVKPGDSRPVGPVGHCTYCREPIGKPHKESCVCRERTVVYRVTMEVVCAVPAHWDKHSCEFHKNESSWCADNFIDQVSLPATGCCCNAIEFSMVREATAEDEELLPRMASEVLPRTDSLGDSPPSSDPLDGRE